MCSAAQANGFYFAQRFLNPINMTYHTGFVAQIFRKTDRIQSDGLVV
jgi:hypothetical protein